MLFKKKKKEEAKSLPMLLALTAHKENVKPAAAAVYAAMMKALPQLGGVGRQVSVTEKTKAPAKYDVRLPDGGALRFVQYNMSDPRTVEIVRRFGKRLKIADPAGCCGVVPVDIPLSSPLAEQEMNDFFRAMVGYLNEYGKTLQVSDLKMMIYK